MIIYLISILIILLLLVLHSVYIPSYRTYRMLQKLPGPKGWPIFGIAFKLRQLRFDEILEYYEKLRIKYPRLAATWVLGVPSVFLYNPDDIGQIMENINNIGKGYEYNYFSAWLNEGLLTSKGQKWDFRRKLLAPCFHYKILEKNLACMQKHAKLLLEKLLNTDGRPINILPLVSICALDIICEAIMGVSLGALENQDRDYLKNVYKINNTILNRIQKLGLRRDWMFNLTPQGFKHKRYVEELHSYSENIIRERRAVYEKKRLNNTIETTTKKHKAFLDLLIEENLNNKFQLSDKDIREEVDTFLFAGQDTVSISLMFTIYLIGLHEDVQKKLTDELNTIFENNEVSLTIKHLQQMKYLEQVIKESLRLFPSVPYLSRTLNQDVKLASGEILPKGANVTILPYILHRIPEFYPNPEKFDPDRFCLNSYKKHPFAYLPFSGGPRNCLGQKFAMLEMKIILSTLLRSACLKSVTKFEEIKLIPAMVLAAENPILLEVTPRK